MQLGTSVGLAKAEIGMTADEILQNSDQAMYEAKESGGNRVIEYRRGPTLSSAWF